MFGCLRRLGCLIVLLVAAAAGYYWYTHRSPQRTAATSSGAWHKVTPNDGVRGERTVTTLQSSSGKVFANLTGAEAVGYLLQRIAGQFPPSASQDVQAMIAGDTLNVRAVLPLRELGADRALGPLASLLSDRDTVQLGGTATMVRPGLAQFRVTTVTIHGFTLPSKVIPKLIGQMRHQTPEGIAPDALALPLPPYISDIRIGNGKVTLYKNV
jgi:hypothetical protein